MTKTINIFVDTKGEIKIETNGFVGEGCVKDSEFVKKALGQEMHRELKQVYFMQGEQEKAFIPLCG
jgi:hypothetical protein